MLASLEDSEGFGSAVPCKVLGSQCDKELVAFLKLCVNERNIPIRNLAIRNKREPISVP